ncbi:hypothetical protein A9Q84_09830 [Halobacteriovorax marinus]|uniref:Inner membrane protein n=1 Tax=Halobacteriovorax marinus TaxID=97084 RepID=A0A1Y5F761_9BACT|nr:hypothetical protein A9Q84_09830 [Halobacteriovorax marinus]
MLRKTYKFIFIVLGLCSLFLGVIGIFLPILPTTPLLLLSAFFFSKGSSRLHHWLLNQPKIGPMIQAWEEHKVISPRAKALATLMIVLLFSFSIVYVSVAIWIKVVMAITGISVIAFILSRKSSPSLE